MCIRDSYKGYPALIQASGKNGWKQLPPATVPKAQYDALLADRDALRQRYDALAEGIRKLAEIG